MKSIRLVALVLIVGMMGVGCGSTSSSLASLASNPMISSLTSGLGLTANQAIGGAGSLLAIAGGNLDADNFKKVKDAIPGADAIMDSGLELAGLDRDKVKSIADMSGSLGKLGLTNDQLTKVSTGVSDFMSKGGNTEAADLFKGAIK